MKALEILKEYRNIDYGCDMDNHTERCDEAIAELEKAMNLTRREWYQKGFNEAMKQRTCEGCIRLYFDEIEKVYKCWNDVSNAVGYLHGEAVIRNIKDFCCVHHQPKDNK